MFSSHNYLKRKTPQNGINRKEFIEHLVEEYYTSTNVEAQEQVTANLANFSYDPINWNYLKQAEALQLFVEILAMPNPQLQLHGLVGLCNICLDTDAHSFILHQNNLALVLALFLNSDNNEILLNCLTLYYQLLSNPQREDLKHLITIPAILKHAAHIRQTNNDKRLTNLATLFLEDYGTRSVILHLPSN